MLHYQKSYPGARENLPVFGSQASYLKLNSPDVFNRSHYITSRKIECVVFQL